MSYWGWKPYVSAAAKKRRAATRIAKLKKGGHPVAPVIVSGRKIANSFWGEAWCGNLERYTDYESRLPRGRTYVRNGSVIDLQIGKGQVTAAVSGSDLYSVNITVAPVTRTRWKAICRDCAGRIDSLMELLQGRIAKGIMDRVCREADGLFPAPKEIKLSCDCPDWADMCKHVAAVLYGVGARLDEKPALIFLLRGVNESEMIASAGETLARPGSLPETANRLVDGDMAALFGLDMADSAAPKISANAPGSLRQRRTMKKAKIQTVATPAIGASTALSKSTSRNRVAKVTPTKKPAAGSCGKPPRASVKVRPKRNTKVSKTRVLVEKKRGKRVARSK